MERSDRTQSILHMHESLARVVPSQAQIHLDVIRRVNIAYDQDFIAHMVDFCAWYGIDTRLLRDLSQSNDIRTVLLFVRVQNNPLSLSTQTLGCSRIKELPAGGVIPAFLSFFILAVYDQRNALVTVRFASNNLCASGSLLIVRTDLVRCRTRIELRPLADRFREPEPGVVG